MRIDRALNLVFPIERDEGIPIWIHSLPVSLAVFETYAGILGTTFTSIYANNGAQGWMAGPRTAKMLLKAAAIQRGGDDLWAEVEKGFINEIRRLTSVIQPGVEGIPLLLADAIRKDVFTEDELSYVENLLVFFTLAWRMHGISERTAVVNMAARLSGGSTSSLSATEFASSQKTSKPTDSSGKAAESSAQS